MVSSTCSIGRTGQLLLAKAVREEAHLGEARSARTDGRCNPIRSRPRRHHICPAVEGATNWLAPAYSPDTRLYYVMALETVQHLLARAGDLDGRDESYYSGDARRVPGTEPAAEGPAAPSTSELARCGLGKRPRWGQGLHLGRRAGHRRSAS